MSLDDALSRFIFPHFTGKSPGFGLPDLPGAPLPVIKDIIAERPFESVLQPLEAGIESFQRDTPDVPPLPPVVEAPPALPPAARDSTLVGESERRARDRTSRFRRQNIFNVGGPRGLPSVGPLRTMRATFA